MTDSPDDHIPAEDSTEAVNSTPQTPDSTGTEPVAASTAAPVDGTTTTTTQTAPPAKRFYRAPVVAAFVVGALIIGGGVGGGVAAAVVAANQGSSSSASAPKAQNVTVNNTDKVNVVSAVAAKVEPSVVTINVTGTSEAGTGSGVILTDDGYVLTNTHVVTLDGETSSGKIQVTASNGQLYDATVIGTDPIVDLAVIKLKNASGLTPVDFANSSKLNVGQTAIAIGAPLGLSNTVTSGIVSSLNRSITIASSAVPDSSSSDSGNSNNSPFDFWNGTEGGQSQTQTPSTATATISLPVIQTDAAINPGNSGGALLDSDGKVIGINVAIASAGSTSDSSSQSGSIGVGFAIPANLAQRVAQEIMKSGKATHGLLGASVTDVATSDTSSTVGAVIKSVVSGGSADKAGLKAGDVVTSFNGVPITGSTDLTAQVRFLAAGANASLTYERGGKSNTVDVTLGTLAS
jgi:putative serine protease PepD